MLLLPVIVVRTTSSVRHMTMPMVPPRMILCVHLVWLLSVAN